MIGQSQICEKSRLKLVNWLIAIHNKFHLLEETLFLTINIIDRYLSLVNFSLDKLYLLGISATFISSKYQEIYPPDIRDFTYTISCTKEEVFKMEDDILRKLKFDLLIVSPLVFFNRMYFISANSKSELTSQKYIKLYFLGLFIMELSLFEYKMLKYPASVIASSALLIGRKLLNITPFWPKSVLHDQGFKNTGCINDCASDLLKLIKTEKELTMNSLREKFSKTTHMSIYSLLGMNKIANENPPRKK